MAKRLGKRINVVRAGSSGDIKKEKRKEIDKKFKQYEESVALRNDKKEAKYLSDDKYVQLLNEKVSNVCLDFMAVAEQKLNERWDPENDIKSADSEFNKHMNAQMVRGLQMAFGGYAFKGGINIHSLMNAALAYTMFKAFGGRAYKELKKRGGLDAKSVQEAKMIKNMNYDKGSSVYGTLTPSDMSPQTAAMLKLSFGKQAYKLMRQPGANEDDIINKYNKSCLYVDNICRKLGFTQKELDEEQGKIYYAMSQADPSIRNMFEETAGPYGAVPSMQKVTHTEMNPDTGVPETWTEEVWDGSYRMSDGKKLAGNFHVRKPKPPVFYKKMLELEVDTRTKAMCGLYQFCENDTNFIGDTEDAKDGTNFRNIMMESAEANCYEWVALAEDDCYNRGAEDIYDDPETGKTIDPNKQLHDIIEFGQSKWKDAELAAKRMQSEAETGYAELTSYMDACNNNAEEKAMAEGELNNLLTKLSAYEQQAVELQAKFDITGADEDKEAIERAKELIDKTNEEIEAQQEFVKRCDENKPSKPEDERLETLRSFLDYQDFSTRVYREGKKNGLTIDQICGEWDTYVAGECANITSMSRQDLKQLDDAYKMEQRERRFRMYGDPADIVDDPNAEYSGGQSFDMGD